MWFEKIHSRCGFFASIVDCWCSCVTVCVSQLMWREENATISHSIHGKRCDTFTRARFRSHHRWAVCNIEDTEESHRYCPHKRERVCVCACAEMRRNTSLRNCNHNRQTQRIQWHKWMNDKNNDRHSLTRHITASPNRNGKKQQQQSHTSATTAFVVAANGCGDSTLVARR